jgi:hypothetical protein
MFLFNPSGGAVATQHLCSSYLRTKGFRLLLIISSTRKHQIFKSFMRFKMVPKTLLQYCLFFNKQNAQH